PGTGFHGGASLGPARERYGMNLKDPREFRALRPTGDVIWQRAGLFAEENAIVSPDGRRLVFRGRDTSTNLTGLLLVQDDGKTVRLVSRSGTVPSWSANGSMLSYEQNHQIFVYDLNSGESHKVAEGVDPQWSPDGSAITLRSSDDRYWITDPGGNTRRELS